MGSSSLRFFLHLLLSLSLFFSSSPLSLSLPPPDSRSSRVARVRSCRQSVQKRGYPRREALEKWISFAYSSNCIPSTRFLSARQVSSKQPCRPDFFFSPLRYTPSFLFPFSLLSNDRPTDTAPTRRPIVAAGLSFNLSIITLVSIRSLSCHEEEIVNGWTKGDFVADNWRSLLKL